jgi:hypothetical protein
MEAQVGDTLVIEGNRVGIARKTGTVVQVHEAQGRQHYTVRWDDGRENTIFPGSDCHVLHTAVEYNPPSRTVTTRVDLRFEEDDDHTEAWATLSTKAGEFTGWGRARRNPVDRNVPLVGEELAAARALMELANKLRAQAGQALVTGAPAEAHLAG